jgi:hypothetical protein
MMAIAERTAETIWEGGLARGHGGIRPASGAFDELPVTWAARTEDPDGRTSPEELAAVAAPGGRAGESLDRRVDLPVVVLQEGTQLPLAGPGIAHGLHRILRGSSVLTRSYARWR